MNRAILLLAASLQTILGTSYCRALEFTAQDLGVPFEGQITGSAMADLNNDGYMDILYSAGRHWIDQSYAYINLGPDPEKPGHFKFSEALPFGKPGGYYQVDVFNNENNQLPYLAQGHKALLLAGGDCSVATPNQFGSCEPKSDTPATLLDVVVTGCSVHAPDVPCELVWNTLWTDPFQTKGGDRNGAFAPALSRNKYNGPPMIVLVGVGDKGISVYEADEQGIYGNVTYVVPATGVANRYTGLATGYFGDAPAVIATPRTKNDVGPSSYIAVVRDNESPEHFRHEVVFSPVPYEGDDTLVAQTTGIAVADLNGDGLGDIVSATFLSQRSLRNGFPLPQRYYMAKNHGKPDYEPIVAYQAESGGRSVGVGQIFEGSPYPDIAFGTAGLDQIVLMKNMGNDPETGKFLGFKKMNVFRDPEREKCTIRSTTVASLAPCSVSVVCAVTCGPDDFHGNVIYNAMGVQVNCPAKNGVRRGLRGSSLPGSSIKS